jgi:S1-C subfamily serine protease
MSTENGPNQYGTPPPPPPPPPPWPGDYGWQPGPGPGYGQVPWADQQGAGHRKPRRRATMLVSGAAALGLLAGGSAWAVASMTGSSTLSATEIAARTDPGLVDVISTLGYQHGTAEGTGMVLTPDGEVLTNNHVVAGSTSVKVRDIGNGKTYTAKVVGYSDTDDVAVLRLAGASGLSTVSLGNSDTVKVAQQVTALGNAEGKDGTPSVAAGTVTSLGNTITAEDSGDGAQEHLTDMIRTNADIEPGDSGGPLLNSAGQVIGMDTAASTSNSSGFGTTAKTATTAFSIPINKALSLAKQIEAGKASSAVHIGATAFLGVQVSSQSSQGGVGQGGSGVSIVGTVEGTAAGQAGLTFGDTITSVGGHATSSPSDLQEVIEGYHPGDKVSVGWTDGFGQSHSATVTLTQGPTG